MRRNQEIGDFNLLLSGMTSLKRSMIALLGLLLVSPACALRGPAILRRAALFTWSIVRLVMGSTPMGRVPSHLRYRRRQPTCVFFQSDTEIHYPQTR